jgi:hypothetical protein
MKCIAVPERRPVDPRLERADAVINSLLELTPALLARLGAP